PPGWPRRRQALAVGSQPWPMRGRPFRDQANRGPGLESTGQWVPVEGEGPLLPLVLRVEVRESMLAVEHPDHDAEEDGDDRHVLILPHDTAMSGRRSRSARSAG